MIVIPSGAEQLCLAVKRVDVLGGVPDGKTIAELSREFGCSTQTIRNWIGEAAADARQKPGAAKDALNSAERDELARLRRRVRQLEEKFELPLTSLNTRVGSLV